MNRVTLTRGWPFFSRTGAKRTEHIDAIMDGAQGNAPGLMVGGNKLSCVNGTIINVSPIHCLTLGTATYSKLSGLAYTPAGLSNNVWYYLYASDVGGVLTFSHDTTVPDTGQYFKNGATTHRYLGAFRRGASAIYPFTKIDGRYSYARQTGTQSFLAEGGIVSATDHSVDLSGLVPPHASLLTVEWQVQVNGGGQVTAELRQQSGSGTEKHLIISSGANLDLTTLIIPDMLATGTPQVVVKATNGGGATGTMSVFVNGWVE